MHINFARASSRIMLCSIHAAQGGRLNLKVESCGFVSSDTVIPKTGIPIVGSAAVQLCNFVQLIHTPSPLRFSY